MPFEYLLRLRQAGVLGQVPLERAYRSRQNEGAKALSAACPFTPVLRVIHFHERKISKTHDRSGYVIWTAEGGQKAFNSI